MPIYLVEARYHMPMFRRRTYQAANLEDACRLAVDDEDWDDQECDLSVRWPHFISAAWQGNSSVGPQLSVPEKLASFERRKVVLFDELVALLKEPAQPMGLSEHDFKSWLPRAQAVLARADAIVGNQAEGD